MRNERSDFTEQAINKIAEVALAKLLDVKRLTVQIQTNFNQLSRGEIETITIDLYDLRLRQDLRVEALQLKIGRVTVKPRKAAFGKIELVHPSEGTFQVVLREHQLTAALNAASFRQAMSQQRNAPGGVDVTQIEHIQCSLQENGAIVLTCEERLNTAADRRSGTMIARPRIEAEGQAIVMDRETVEGDLSSSTVAAVMAQVGDILSLHDLANRGTTLHIQQVDMVAGSVMIRANAQIEQFPTA